MTAARVLLTDFAWPELDLERASLAAAGAELIVAPATDEAALAAAASEADAIMTTWARVTGAVIRAASRCRVIARLGIGLDNIDVAEATRRRIPVTNVPDYCLHEVAEHTLALLLALARKVAWFHAQTKQGRYDLAAALPLRRLAGQTLGLVGLGRIGTAVASRATALGLNVLDARRSDKPAPSGVTLAPLERLLAESDYVSLHLPLTPATYHLLGPQQFALFKPSGALINTARGGLVDAQALAGALATGRLAGAALDVQEPEPPDLTAPPWNDPRVIVTPHAAFASTESLHELRSRALGQVLTVLRGERPAQVVNPEVYG